MSSFWAKAEAAADAAQLLVGRGDCNGAVNRANYAMFHAARAALERVHPDLVATRRHATIIGRFAQKVVRAQGIDPNVGRSLNLAFDQRLIADYERQSMDLSVANAIVEDMKNAHGAPGPHDWGRHPMSQRASRRTWVGTEETAR